MKGNIDVWLKQAQRDLKSAYNSYNSGDYYVSALLVQQAVEKALKSLYFKDHRELIKTHDLAKLAKLIEAPAKVLQKCIRINPVYIIVRYPEDGTLPADKINKLESESLLKLAEEIMEWLLKQN